MRGSIVLLMTFCVVLSFGVFAQAQTGAREFAQRLDSSRSFYHDRLYGGAEVIFRSSGVATPEAAQAAWLRSRAGHRELLLSGSITDIQCSGGVCVGRGGSIASKTTTKTRTVARRSVFRRR